MQNSIIDFRGTKGASDQMTNNELPVPITDFRLPKNE
jgi:hypothetical protein